MRQLPLLHPYEYLTNWNAAPSQQLPVLVLVDGELELQMMRWGLIPGWLKPGETPKVTPINARSETITEKPMFRNLIKRQRCIVPANGFYEWKHTGGKKQPYFIHRRDAPVMLFAGLFDYRHDGGDEQGSYTILTGAPNRAMAEIHDRMPIMVDREDVPLWLDPDIDEVGPLEHLFQPVADEEIEMYPVSTAVNNVRNNGPELIEPVAVQDGLF